MLLKGFVVAIIVSFYDKKMHLDFEACVGSRWFSAQRFKLDKWDIMYESASLRTNFSSFVHQTARAGRSQHGINMV